MPQLRKDLIIGRWGVINSDHLKSPQDFPKEDHRARQLQVCPFCPGREDRTPPELDAVRWNENGPWQVRTVPNKFPALVHEDHLQKEGWGLFDIISGYGTHEVVIETPDHHKQMADLTPAELALVFGQYQRRFKALAYDPRLKYIVIFKNFGASAGATVEHSHSQIIALPMVPKSVLEEIEGAEHYHLTHGRCVYCDMLQQEHQDKERLVSSGHGFVNFCPFAPRYDFETWVMPEAHQAHFIDLDGRGLECLASHFLDILNRLKRCLSNPSYNFYLHTAPVHYGRPHCYHWHIEIIPRLTRSIGFEWGTGLHIVSTFPHAAARFLREA